MSFVDQLREKTRIAASKEIEENNRLASERNLQNAKNREAEQRIERLVAAHTIENIPFLALHAANFGKRIAQAREINPKNIATIYSAIQGVTGNDLLGADAMIWKWCQEQSLSPTIQSDVNGNFSIWIEW